MCGPRRLCAECFSTSLKRDSRDLSQCTRRGTGCALLFMRSDVAHQPRSDSGAFWRTPHRSSNIMTLLRGASLAASRMIQGGGTHWTVREAAWAGPSGRGRTCLIFENDAVVRRVRVFPADWRTCSDDALYALSLVF